MPSANVRETRGSSRRDARSASAGVASRVVTSERTACTSATSAGGPFGPLPRAGSVSPLRRIATHASRNERAPRAVLPDVHPDARRVRPEELPWPELDARPPRAAARVSVLELRALDRAARGPHGHRVRADVDDPLIREAVALQGVEETRHGRLMAHVDRPLRHRRAAARDRRSRRRARGLLRSSGSASAPTRSSGSARSRSRASAACSPTRCSRSSTTCCSRKRATSCSSSTGGGTRKRAPDATSPFVRSWNALRYHVRAAMGTATGATELPADADEARRSRARRDREEHHAR